MALVEAAHAAARSKGTYLSARFTRVRGRRGYKKAVIAIAHDILVISYHLLSRSDTYSDLGADYYLRRDHDTQARRLVRQLERLGFGVTITREDAA